MPARLTLFPALGSPRRFLLFEEHGYALGRDEACELVLDDERVSRRHARFEARPDGWYLMDLGSKNGVAVDGLSAREARLVPGCWLSIGGVVGQFEALDESGARRELERRARRWSLSAEHHRQLDPRLDLPALLDQVLASVLELSGAERGFVLLEGADGLEVAAASGLVEDELGRAEFRGSVGAVERALTRGRAVASADVAQHVSLAGRASVQAGGIRALVCLPLAALGRRLGVIYADSAQPGVCFDEHDVELLEAYAGHAALALALGRLEREVEQLTAALPEVEVSRAAHPPPTAPARRAWRAIVDGFGERSS